MTGAPSEAEVIVTIDGLPRPAVVVTQDVDRVLVRFRQAGGYEERWVPTDAVVPVEVEAKKLPLAKLIGLGVLAVLGLLLLLWPSGSDKPLLPPTPSPSVSAGPSRP